MKKNLLGILFIFTLCGCSISTKYSPYTSESLPPLSKFQRIEIYDEGQRGPEGAKSIGRVEFTGRVSQGITEEKLKESARALARKKGANVIIQAKSKSQSFSGKHSIPGSASYHPIMLNNRQGQPDEVMYVEYRTPSRDIPYQDTLWSFSGELAVASAIESEEVH